MNYSLLWTDDGVFIAFGSEIVRRLDESMAMQMHAELDAVPDRWKQYMLGLMACALEGE